MRRLLLAALLLFPLGLAAQTYPDQTDPQLVDLGEMLSDQEEGTLRTQLTRLAEEDETEMVVVTLPSVAEVAGTLTVQEYAEGLFEDWGVGTAEANTGVLMVVFAEDRELYIALGQDYDGAWNGLTAGIIQFRIIPAFRDDNYALGISNGIDAVRDMIVRPFRADAPVPEPITEAAPAAAPAEGEGGGGRTGLYIFGGIIVAVGALIARAVSKNKARLAGMECPACGHKIGWQAKLMAPDQCKTCGTFLRARGQ